MSIDKKQTKVDEVDQLMDQHVMGMESVTEDNAKFLFKKMSEYNDKKDSSYLTYDELWTYI